MNAQTKYYRIQAAGHGAYDFSHDGTILAVRGDREWLLTDEWCGDGVEGSCYRQHVAGRRRPWPKAAEHAEDRTADFDDLPSNTTVRDLHPSEIRKILGV